MYVCAYVYIYVFEYVHENLHIDCTGHETNQVAFSLIRGAYVPKFCYRICLQLTSKTSLPIVRPA